MSSGPAATRLDDLILELDLVIYSMERKAPEDEDAAVRQRTRTLRELERIRDALREVERDL